MFLQLTLFYSVLFYSNSSFPFVSIYVSAAEYSTLYFVYVLVVVMKQIECMKVLLSFAFVIPT